ncbi:hypothetical protein AVEN_17407-1 [Araneus ventricosus]|uniref:Uncharacterized protein n=1 Tax=Araneus ventricosus TaxID=182803 RepID=A0A4Y2H2L6_ARAVE|nr:hypothetical protein AVEN_17407-1 [Araneus ventricosus]
MVLEVKMKQDYKNDQALTDLIRLEWYRLKDWRDPVLSSSRAAAAASGLGRLLDLGQGPSDLEVKDHLDLNSQGTIWTWRIWPRKPRPGGSGVQQQQQPTAASGPVNGPSQGHLDTGPSGPEDMLEAKDHLDLLEPEDMGPSQGPSGPWDGPAGTGTKWILEDICPGSQDHLDHVDPGLELQAAAAAASGPEDMDLEAKDHLDLWTLRNGPGSQAKDHLTSDLGYGPGGPGASQQPAAASGPGGMDLKPRPSGPWWTWRIWSRKPRTIWTWRIRTEATHWTSGPDLQQQQLRRWTVMDAKDHLDKWTWRIWSEAKDHLDLVDLLSFAAALQKGPGGYGPGSQGPSGLWTWRIWSRSRYV